MKNNYYFLYYFFDSAPVRWVRVAIFFLIGILVYFNLSSEDLIIRLLPFYFFLLLQELFIHFKLESRYPAKKVTDTYSHVIECVDFKTRAHLERHPVMERVIKELLHEHEIKYLNKLLNYTFEKPQTEIAEEDVLGKAKEIVLSVQGKYIHAVDIYVAYLLLANKQEKILFNKEIDETDMLTCLSWVRKKVQLDGRKHKELHFSGSGVFDFFVFGWSAELAKYAVNFTRETLSQNTPRPVGRDREYDLLVTALSKNRASNALLVGDAGVGKTSLISQFVIDSDMSLLPHQVSNKIVFKLYPEKLLAGINNEGDLEERFVSLFSELSHAGNIIVYIPNIENIFGGGGLNVDISGALVEYLKSSNIKIIGSTTPDEFQRYIYPKQEIKELFDVIDIQEPSSDTAIYMVLEKAQTLEHMNSITITYQAVKEACHLSNSYVNDGSAMPGRAIRLLEDVISYATTHGNRKITKKEVQDFIQQKTHIVLDKPTPEESQKLLHLEEALHRQIIAQNEAVVAIADAMRRVRSGIKDEQKPIASFLFLGPTGVGKTETAKALASSYFGDETSMIRMDMSEYQNPDAIDRLLGSKSGPYEETLADKILKNPFTLILLDEFEKAYPPILDLFLQILDEGHLTDNIGRTVSFSNSMIIATSNAGSEFIREEYKEGVDTEGVKKQLLETIMQKNIFKPELINRFDGVIVFRALTEPEVVEVAKIFLQEVIDEVSQKHILLSYTPEAAEFIAHHAYSVEFGARNIRRFIEQSVENQLSKMILSNDLPGGSTASIVVEENSLVIKK